MTLDLLVDALRLRDIQLAAGAEGELDVDGPADALTPELVRQIREQKPGLLSWLAAPSLGSDGDTIRASAAAPDVDGRGARNGPYPSNITESAICPNCAAPVTEPWRHCDIVAGYEWRMCEALNHSVYRVAPQPSAPPDALAAPAPAN